MYRDIVSNDWFVVLILFCLIIVTLTKVLFTDRFNMFLTTILDSKYLAVYKREHRVFDVFDVILFINLVISVSLFSSISYNTFYNDQGFDPILFIKTLSVFSLCLLIKNAFERLLGHLFKINAIIYSYIFLKITYRNYNGLLLLAFNILLLFVFKPSKVALFFVFGLIILISIVGFISAIIENRQLLLKHLFYFILYLCTLEISPYIILYKVFVEKFNA